MDYKKLEALATKTRGYIQKEIQQLHEATDFEIIIKPPRSSMDPLFSSPTIGYKFILRGRKYGNFQEFSTRSILGKLGLFNLLIDLMDSNNHLNHIELPIILQEYNNRYDELKYTENPNHSIDATDYEMETKFDAFANCLLLNRLRAAKTKHPFIFTTIPDANKTPWMKGWKKRWQYPNFTSF